MSNRLIFFLINIFSIGFSYAQSPAKLAEEGDYQFQTGNYFGALYLYEAALEELPQVMQLRYKYANACRLAFSYDKALDAYLKVIANNERRYPQAVFYTASILKMQGFYSEALRRFRYFYKNFPNDSLAAEAKQEILRCEWISKQKQETDSLVTVQLLSDSVNSPLFEYGAIATKKGILFSAIQSTDSLNQFAKVYSTDSSQSIVELMQLINSFRFHVTDIALTNNEKEAFFSVCTETNGKYICKIYSTQKNDSVWQQPQVLPEAINYPLSNSTQPDVVSIGDSLLLFFASNRIGGVGGLDIWCAVRYKGEYLSVTNLGSVINTEMDEVTPFYNYEDSTLYFSSLGHAGYGGYDVFRAKGCIKQWTVPINMQMPINTSYNDFYYSEMSDTTLGFLTSNRRAVPIEGIAVNFNDIYQLQLPPRKKRTPRTLVDAGRSLHDIGLIQLYFDFGQPQLSTDKTCDYRQLTNNFLSRKAFYLKMAEQKSLELNKDYSKTELENFFLNDIELGFERLQHLANVLSTVLNNGATVTIQITAFTSPEGDSASNNLLAQRRAHCIEQWLCSPSGGKLAGFLGTQLFISSKNHDNKSDFLLDTQNPSYEYNPWVTRSFFKRRVEVSAVLKSEE